MKSDLPNTSEANGFPSRLFWIGNLARHVSGGKNGISHAPHQCLRSRAGLQVLLSLVSGIWLSGAKSAVAGEAPPSGGATVESPVSVAPAPGTIDLPTALRLAGANNLDVQIAREKVNEARAVSDSARARFFPWIAPSIVRPECSAVSGF